MSAYICNPEHFGILAAYAAGARCIIREYANCEPILAAQNVARELARENIRSVAHRYPGDKDGHRPGPCLLDAEIEEAAAIYAAHFVTHPQRLSSVQVLKLCNGYAYQACETDDWEQSLACRQIDWIKSDAIRSLEGYELADWSYEQSIAAIDALYEGSQA